MAKIIEDKIWEFISELYQEEYLYAMKTYTGENLVRAIYQILKPYERKHEIKEAMTE